MNLKTVLDEIEALHPQEQWDVVRHVHDLYSRDRSHWLPAGDIIATNVSLDVYMADYAADHCEWVEGYVIKMAPAELKHNDLIGYLYALLNAYFEFTPLGRTVLQPFVMRLPAFPNRRREPDLIVVLNDNLPNLRPTYMDGPADICIEIVSEGSVERDYGDKFVEYEKGGVKEYWTLDPLRDESRFYRLNEAGRYMRYAEDAQGGYRTPALPGFVLHVPTLWADRLPGPAATVELVKLMLKKNSID